MARIILLLHGVGVLGERGPWQRPVGKIMGPHFHVVPIKYSHYRWFGFLSLIFDLPVLVLGGVSIYALHTFTKAPLWPIIFAVLLISFVWARVEYRRTLRKIVRVASLKVSGNFVLPYVVAHSLGTHFVGTALRKYPGIRLGKVIFAGSVLPQDYPWQDVFAANPGAVECIRNDVGRRDLVPRLARVAHRIWLLRGFGMSGWAGFNELDDLVHTVNAPEEDCTRCEECPHPAPVHNVICKDFGHSGAFRDPRYTAYTWLPFLWGFGNHDYSDFIKLCFVLEEYQEREDYAKYAIAEYELHRAKWAWTGGMSFREYIENLIMAYPSDSTKDIPHIASLVIKTVVRDLWHVSHSHPKKKGANDLPTFNPIVSILKAINIVMKSVATVA